MWCSDMAESIKAEIISHYYSSSPSHACDNYKTHHCLLRCVCVCARVCVCLCVQGRVCSCVHNWHSLFVYMCVCILYSLNILTIAWLNRPLKGCSHAFYPGRLAQVKCVCV